MFFVLDSPIGGLPPLGRFLNPFAGFWTNNRAQDAIPVTLEFPGLVDDVEIVWDTRRVPHIIAKNLSDLYFAQGYIVAMDRLWQMDFQVCVAAGRLSEIVGPKAVELDRFRRRIGLVTGAKKALAQVMENPESRRAVEAFAAGVNARIEQLDPSTLPVEYKILDWEPELWTPLKSALLLKSMTYTLTFRNSELSMTKTREVLGENLMELLYPEELPFSEPVVPAGTRWGFRPRAAVEASPGNRAELSKVQHWDNSPNGPGDLSDVSHLGSNSWAVSGTKTASGYPILCNDPHLSLSLPSIWYEMQLMAPGLNVYGVTIPGAPGVLIGFNTDIAWGTTNAGSDVLDWYVVSFQDSTRREYRYGSGWKPVTARVETIAVRGADPVFDTVLTTHHGPVVRLGDEPSINPTVPQDAALRWTAHDASNELLAFLGMNSAQNHEMFTKALERFDAPAQNFVYADRWGNIGFIHAGKFPVRRRGQGRYLSNGSDSTHEWKTWVPRDHLPQMLNPLEGFVGSANQPPTDSKYPYYLGSAYASFDRSARINQVLRSLDQVTPEMMISLQNDVFSLQAQAIVPVLLATLRRCELTEPDLDLIRELEMWNFEYRRELYGPTIYEEWWRELHVQIWRDDVERDAVSLRWPRRDVTTAMILNGSIVRFADNRNTAERERWDDIVCDAFHQAKSSLEARLGPLDRAWQWGFARGSSIPHVAKIPGLGQQSLNTSGSPNVINGTTTSAGPSWRMVVELGPDIRAWGIYPGGQSGNPGSESYDNFITDWMRGFTYELAFMRFPEDSLHTLMQRTRLRRIR
jgi:penicillin amidase